MSESRDHQSWQDAAGAYLLRALPDDELAGFEAHLRECARCRAEIASLRVATDALPRSAPPMEPPPELKDRIMRVVRSEAELLSAAGAQADVPEAPRRRERRRRWFPLTGGRLAPAWAAGLAALAIGALGGVALSGGFAGGGGTRNVTAQVNRAVSPNAEATLRISDDRGVLRVHGMRNPAGHRVWQVWLVRKGERSPEPTNALFTVASDGTASVSVPGDLDSVDKVLVSSEPEGGSMVPTTQPVISVDTA